MVYAVVTDTIYHFGAALGRRIHWRRQEREKGSPPGVLPGDIYTLNLYPHAMVSANAFYSPQAHGILFGYFRADTQNPGRNLPGQTVFTCLSHDIIVHETTHAIIDGIRGFFTEQTNPDVPAFHEGLADLAALFRHFTHREVLLDTIQRTGGALYQYQLRPEAAMFPDDRSGPTNGTTGGPDGAAPTEGPSLTAQISQINPLVELAQQFGEATGLGQGLRSALGTPPNADDIKRFTEPHRRGSILVAAVFDAYFSIYVRRTADLFRIYRAGEGSDHPTDLPGPLAERLCDEAARTADQFFRVCVRALDYCPPIDITFGDFLRAVITADCDLHPVDDLGLRDAFDCGVTTGRTGKGDIGTIKAAVAHMAGETKAKLTLIIVTHRHMDHIIGFSRCADQFKQFKVDAIWMPYWETEYDAQVSQFQEDLTALALDVQDNLALAAEGTPDRDEMLAMLENATGRSLGLAGTGGGTNADSLALLKHGLGVKPAYYFKGSPAALPKALVDAGLTAEILGPPPKDATAFMKLTDLKKGVGQYLQAAGNGGGRTGPVHPFDTAWRAAATAYPLSAFREWAPRGPGAVADPKRHSRPLEKAVESAQPSVLLTAVKQLDAFLNNQSLVVLFTFQGKTLLFAGDAQAGNWEYWLYDSDKPTPTPAETLGAEGVGVPGHLDFYKVGHHGSTNATPIAAVDAMNVGFTALCSTQADSFGSIANNSEVPRQPLIDALAKKCALVRSDQIAVTLADRQVPPSTNTSPALPKPKSGTFTVGSCFVDYTF